MCGVPHHAVRAYLGKLTELGHRVALCEQLEDPKVARGIVKRDVVRVITPGVVLDEESLDPRAPSYVAAAVGDAARRLRVRVPRRDDGRISRHRGTQRRGSRRGDRPRRPARAGARPRRRRPRARRGCVRPAFRGCRAPPSTTAIRRSSCRAPSALRSTSRSCSACRAQRRPPPQSCATPAPPSRAPSCRSSVSRSTRAPIR